MLERTSRLEGVCTRCGGRNVCKGRGGAQRQGAPWDDQGEERGGGRFAASRLEGEFKLDHEG